MKFPCRLVQYEVNFESLGWDWIMAPSKYSMNLCQGECNSMPLAQHMNASNHAVIQNLYHSILPDKIPPPCCVPIEFEHENLLMVVKKSQTSTEGGDLLKHAFGRPQDHAADEGSDVKLETFQGMKATRCGCR